MDVARLSPSKDTTGATIDQVRRLVELLQGETKVPLFVFDAGYDPIGLAYGLAGTEPGSLSRIRDDRVFYADPPARAKNPGTGKPGTRGRPARHGRRMKCSEPRTWGQPTQRLVTEDPAGWGTVTVTAWAHLHPKLAGRGRWAGHASPPIVKGTVIRVEVHHLPKPTARTKKTLWLFWSGPGTPDLAPCWRAYLRRFDIEHTFRFAKNTLGWTSPSVCCPKQAERWTWLVVGMLTQLRLARDHVQDIRLPWERPRKPHQLTPARTRRGFRRLRALIGTPASPPKTTTAGPGQRKKPQNRPVRATRPSNEPREAIVEV